MKLGTLFSGIGAPELAQPNYAVANRRWYRDLAGQRFGRLLAMEPVGRSSDGHVLWRCRCDCGSEALKASHNLTAKAGTRSCGCLLREAAAARGKRYGGSNRQQSYAIANGEHVYSTNHAWAKAVLRAKGNACERCGWAEARCDVHHTIPKSVGGQNTITNGSVLCPNCHRIAHERGRR